MLAGEFSFPTVYTNQGLHSAVTRPCIPFFVKTKGFVGIKFQEYKLDKFKFSMLQTRQIESWTL